MAMMTTATAAKTTEGAMARAAHQAGAGGTALKRPRQEGHVTQEGGGVRDGYGEGRSAKRQTIRSRSADLSGGVGRPVDDTVLLTSLPAETIRAIVDLVDDRDLLACLLASSCFHVYSRMDTLLRRYALGSGRDILDSDEPVTDVVAVCKRQRRPTTLDMLERPAARGRRDIVSVIMQTVAPALKTFSWTTAPLPTVDGPARSIYRALIAAVHADRIGPIVEIAARLGIVETLTATRLMLHAARAGRLSLVKEFHRAMAHCARKARERDVREGRPPSASIAHAACGHPTWEGNVGTAAWQGGHVDVLDWLIDTRCPRALSPLPHALNEAIMDGNAEVARWAASRLGQRAHCSRHAIDHAASSGHVEAVRWAHESHLRRCAVSTIEAAAAGQGARCIDVLAWVAGEGDRPGAVPEWRDARVAVKAAESGRYEIVRWLAKAHPECLTPEAARCAARHGHADIVLFLHAAGVAPIDRFNPLKRTAKSSNARAVSAVAAAGAAYDARALAIAIRSKSVPMVAALCEHYAQSIDPVEAMRMAGRETACKIARNMAAVLPGACLEHARKTVPPHRSAKALGRCPCDACRTRTTDARRPRRPQAPAV